MPFKSTFPLVDIPKCNILSYLFPENQELSDTPIWIDSSNTQKHLTPRQLLQWVKRLALGLDKLSIERGQRVLTFTSNHIFVPVAYLGVVGSGRVFSGANPSYTVAELAYQIKDTQASILLAHPDVLSTAVAAAQKAGLPGSRVFLFSDVSYSEINGIHDWSTILGSDAEASHYSFDCIAGEDALTTVAALNYSSGTTGLPKGVCISHYNLCAITAQSTYVLYAVKGNGANARSAERWVGFLPLYHVFGQIYFCVLAAKLQIPVYIMKSFDYKNFLHVIQTYRITQLQLAPPIMVLLAKRPETTQYDLSSLTDITCAAAPLSGELQNEVSKKLRVQINQCWGMTELNGGGTGYPLGYVDHTGSVGMLLPNCECKLVDDNGEEVNTSAPGEIYFRGPNVCIGYWQNKAATRDAISSDGWFKTGDVAMTKDDKFWIVDRKKELIKVKGFQVAPAELEAVLLSNESIEDAGVIGVTLRGVEYPRAYIALKEYARGKTRTDEILSWMECRVAKYKQLSGGISFVEEVPKSSSGKLLRRVLREWAKQDMPELERRARAML
ncbi:MAG: hypothetical protein Q9181_005187 [Wetmoreana brouardii]